MAATESTMLELNTPAPDFSLIDPSTNQQVSLQDFSGKPLLVAFICNHCPYVVHIMDEFVAFAKKYQALGIETVAINSNDVDGYPKDAPPYMKELASDKQFSFPYLYDESQAVAKSYFAACTPDFFLFDSKGLLFYRGQFDASRPKNNQPVTGDDMIAAVESLLAGDEKFTPVQIASMGCNIKWKQGNEPSYF